MTYDVGTHVDLSYLNKRPAVKLASEDIRAVARQFIATEFEPGTYLDLSFMNRQLNILSSLVSQSRPVQA